MVPKALGRWRALSGEKFLTFSETYAQDAEGLYSVEAALVVRDSSSGNVTCSVLNAILGQEKVMAIFIPGQCYFLLPGGQEGIGRGGLWVCWAELSWAIPMMGCLAGPRALLPPEFSLEASFHGDPDCADTPNLWGCLLH